MRKNKKSREPPPTSDLWNLSHGVTCYRCGKQEPSPQTFHLLPGSQHILVCPECYEVLWDWKVKPETKKR